MPDSIRRSVLIRLIHVARRELALDEPTYRSLLQGSGGKASARDMTEPELERVFARMKEAGFKVRSKADSTGTKKPSSITAAKPAAADERLALRSKIDKQAEALGVGESYLNGISKKMFGIDRIQFCEPHQLHKIVAALTYAQRRQTQTQKQEPTP